MWTHSSVPTTSTTCSIAAAIFTGGGTSGAVRVAGCSERSEPRGSAADAGSIEMSGCELQASRGSQDATVQSERFERALMRILLLLSGLRCSGAAQAGPCLRDDRQSPHAARAGRRLHTKAPSGPGRCRARQRRRHRGGIQRYAGRTLEIAALHRRTVGVARALTAAVFPGDARALARAHAVRVAGALDALVIQTARRSLRVQAVGVARALDAGAAGEVALGPPGVAVARTRARPHAAARPDVAGSAAAVGVARALHAASVAQITDPVWALALLDALHAGVGRRLAARSLGAAVAIARALGAAPARLASGAARLAAVGVADALHTHVELRAAVCERLPRALALLRASERAARQQRVAGLIAGAVTGAPALDADVTDTRRPTALALRVDRALDAGAAGARRPFARALRRAPALGEPGLASREQIERAPFVQVAPQQRRQQRHGPSAASPPTRGRHWHRDALLGRQAHGAPPSSRCSASCRAKPFGCRAT